MKEIFIDRQNDLLRIVIRIDGRLKECYVQEENDNVLPGQIYKGVVKNVVPAIKCAFIDIGKSKNAYMYLDNKFNNIKIKKGEEILVEIVKEGEGKKSAKVTSAISIPGRYSVLNTLNNKVNISRKINNDYFIKEVKNNLKKPKDVGITIRTNAEKVSVEEINNEIKLLYKQYLDLIKKYRYSLKTGLIYSDKGIIDKILRDTSDIDKYKIIVNNKDDYLYIENYIKNSLGLKANLKLYDNVVNIFDHYGIEKELLNLNKNKVKLKCGGYIIIEKTEAMYTIDVNSGKNTKNNSIQKTAFSTNLEAAEEIALQIRLRNLSGIIVIDFIDMNDEKDKDIVLGKLKEGFINDKNKIVIYPFTELNLVQIARGRKGKAINSYMEEKCLCCEGKGRRLKYTYIQNLIKNEILKIDYKRYVENIYIEINSIYKKEILKDTFKFVQGIGCLDKKVYVNYIDNIEYFNVEPIIFSNQIDDIKMFKIYG